MGKIGFACKWIDTLEQVNGIKPKDDAKKYNTGSTTVAWLNRQTREVAEQKLWDLMTGNIESIRKLVEKVGSLDDRLRMVRIGSDILPVYTHRDWQYFWQLPDVRAYCERHFATVGDIARVRGVRLSFHPGQFTVLASDNPEIVDRSIEEFEYHVDMARWMGYGRSFQDFKINVHISGRRGPEGIIETLERLTPEARNCITIENDENAWGIESSLELEKHCALVLDIHHHWCREGEYIQPADDRFKRVIDSWRGVRPAMHYSVSREAWLPDHCPNTLPDMTQLLNAGFKKAKLRGHSNFYWNTAVNEYALSFLPHADLMCESKGKNIASFELYNYANTRTNTPQRTSNRRLDVQPASNKSRAETLIIT
jgi:UV DNA damage repair endonuclease